LEGDHPVIARHAAQAIPVFNHRWIASLTRNDKNNVLNKGLSATEKQCGLLLKI